MSYMQKSLKAGKNLYFLEVFARLTDNVRLKFHSSDKPFNSSFQYKIHPSKCPNYDI